MDARDQKAQCDEIAHKCASHKSDLNPPSTSKATLPFSQKLHYLSQANLSPLLFWRGALICCLRQRALCCKQRRPVLVKSTLFLSNATITESARENRSFEKIIFQNLRRRYGVICKNQDIRNMRCLKGQRAFFENPGDSSKIKAQEEWIVTET